MSEIKIINAKKIYHDVPVIDNLNITVPKGSLFTILGPSGCGKTTLLRMIAGFNSIEGGEFYFDDTKIKNMKAMTEIKIATEDSDYVIKNKSTILKKYNDIFTDIQSKK